MGPGNDFPAPRRKFDVLDSEGIIHLSPPTEVISDLCSQGLGFLVMTQGSAGKTLEEHLDEVMARARRSRKLVENEDKNLKDSLLKAAKLNHGSKGDLVQEILQGDKTIPLDEETYKALGFSRLHQVAWEGLDKIFTELMDVPGEDVNARDFKGQTPLHIAAFRGHIKVVKNLLKWNGIEITKSNDETEGDSFTPLHLAADGGHLEVVKMLLKAVKNRYGNSGLEKFVNSTDPELQRTALHYACRNGNVEVVSALLNCKDINIEVKDNFGYTPPILAVLAEGDNDEVVKLFLNLDGPENYEDCPFKSLSGQIDYGLPKPEDDFGDDFGVLYGAKDWRLMFVWPNLVDSYYIDTYCFCILPTQLRNDFDKNWKLPTEDSHFFSALRLAVRGNNGKVLACLLKHMVSIALDKNVILSQSFYSNSTNIKNLINELMHYAARIGSFEALKVLLHFTPNDQIKQNSGLFCDINSSMNEGYKLDINSKMFGKTAAFAAVQSLYRFAHVKVSKEEEMYNLMLWNNILSVVNIFCSMREFDSINRDSKNNTLLYYISESLDVLPRSMHTYQKKMRRIYVEAAMVRCMINSSDLSRLCDYYIDEKRDLQNGCNALLVGATLIAALAVSGMIQPPQPVSGFSHIDHVVNIYWTFNSLSFYFAVYTMISCLKVLMPRRREYIEEELKKLTQSVSLSSLGLTVTTTLAIGAYMAGEHLNGPSRTLAIHSTIFGLLFLVPFIFGAIGKYYWQFFHMLFDLSNWRHIGGGCQRISRFIFGTTFHTSRVQANVGSKARQDNVEDDGSDQDNSSTKSKKKAKKSDVSKKEESNSSERRSLNIDDTDDLVTALHMVMIQLGLVGTIVIFVVNLFAKIDA